jgi:DNA-directed RNA polymerase subunit RPC12/RpoP
MSFMMFQQICRSCEKTWNAAFGIVGMTQIAAPPIECPYCGSTDITKFSDGWTLESGEQWPKQQIVGIQEVKDDH